MHPRAIIMFAVGLCLMATSGFALDPQFQTRVDYAVSVNPQQICTADFNKDGKTDLAVVNAVSNTVSVMMNNGNGTFAAPIDYPVGTHPNAICAIDVDADGFPDLAVTDNSAGTISVLMNLTTGLFDIAITFSTGGVQPDAICSADFDGDNKIDLAVANFGSGNVAVMINLNNSQFPTAVTYATGTNPTSICVSDLDMDGKPDLVVANGFDNNISTLKNNGNGTFAAAVNYAVGIDPVSVCSADLDGNGSPELAVANYGDNTVSVLKNNGNSTFAAAVSYGVGTSPNSVFAADLEKTGKPDLAVANMLSDNVSVLSNLGNGTFAAAVNHVVGTSPYSVCAADFNGDLTPDLAVANGSSNNVSVLISIRQHIITATAGANGAIAPSGLVGVYDATDQIFAITPNTGYHVADVLVDGISVGAKTADTIKNVIANHTIFASFAINTYSITSSAGPNGTISPLGVTVVNYGSNPIFTITPNIGYHVADVLVDGLTVGPVTVDTIKNVSADHTISASFAINTYTLTASADPNGSITPPGITTVNYLGGQVYNISPNSCYHIADVLVDGLSVGAVPTYSFSGVAANRTISATFAINVQTITATAGPNGSITPTGAVPVNCGSDKSFIITPDQYYFVADVKVNGISIGPVTTHTIINVTADQTIAATFACCQHAGDANHDTKINVGDAVFVINYVFKGGLAPFCKDQADANADTKVNVGDAVYLINYVFKAGTAPHCP